MKKFVILFALLIVFANITLAQLCHNNVDIRASKNTRAFYPDTVICNWYDILDPHPAPKDMTVYTYNPDGSTHEAYYYLWNPYSSSWKSNGRETYTYDLPGNTILIITENWDTTSLSWVNAVKDTSIYNVNNQMTEKTVFNWIGGTWINQLHYTYTYDINGNQLSWMDQDWDGSAWKNYSKTVSVYNVLNELTKDTFYIWNTPSVQWKYSSNDIYTYDVNHNLLERTYQNWHSTSSTWINQDKNIYTYDINNNNTMYVSMKWDTILILWKNVMKDSLNYDGNNNLISGYNYYWDDIGSIWKINSRSFHTYDINNNLLTESSQMWNSLTSSWVDCCECDYSYIEINGIAEIGNSNGLSINPNPTSGSFQVDCSESMIRSIEVYNLLGGKVFSTKNYMEQKSVELDISDRPAGIYFVKCKTTKGDFVCKVVKQ